MIQWNDYSEEYRKGKNLMDIKYTRVWNENTHGRFIIGLKLNKGDKRLYVLVDLFDNKEYHSDLEDTFSAHAELASIISQQCGECSIILPEPIYLRDCSVYTFKNDSEYECDLDLLCNCCQKCRDTCGLPNNKISTL